MEPLTVAIWAGAALLAMGGTATAAAAAWTGTGPSPAVRAAILAMCGRHPKILPAFAFAVANLESNFNPGVRLDTRASTNLAAGTQQELSIGLYQINVNPNRPLGHAREAQLAAEGHTVADLSDPNVNAEFWAAHIVESLVDRAEREGRTGDRKWEAVRVWLYASSLSPEGDFARQKLPRFRRVFAKWKAALA